MLKREMAEVLETVKHRDNFDKLPQFPLTSHSAAMDFEMRLRSDKEMQSQLVCQPTCVFLLTISENIYFHFQMNKFSKTNNDDGVNKFIKENLKSLFYHDGVTRKFAWTDAKENIAVKDFTIIQNLRGKTNYMVRDLHCIIIFCFFLVFRCMSHKCRLIQIKQNQRSN